MKTNKIQTLLIKLTNKLYNLDHQKDELNYDDVELIAKAIKQLQKLQNDYEIELYEIVNNLR